MKETLENSSFKKFALAGIFIITIAAILVTWWNDKKYRSEGVDMDAAEDIGVMEN